MFEDLPTSPGVYLFKNDKGRIIYVGKAKNLRSRVRSYFRDKNQTAKTKVLVKNIASKDYYLTNTEVEALLLENRLIKKHRPKYNINLKDDKTYAYIKLTNDEFPKLVSTRRVTRTGTYFGPYPDGYSRNQILKILNNHFRLCRKKCAFDKSCLNYHIKQCDGANIGKESKESYESKLKNVKQVLKGNIFDLEKQIKSNLEKYAANEQYELAINQREMLNSLEILKERQNVDEVRHINQDVIAIEKKDGFAIFTILNVKKGTISGKDQFRIEEEEGVESKFFTNYYYGKVVPHELIISEEFWTSNKEKDILEKYLESLAQRKVKLTVPRQGNKKTLIDLAFKNSISLQSASTLLKERLDLPLVPRVIECFDISNLKDKFIVAGMTSFIDGKPNKEGYRRFKIKSKATQDDFAAMQEVVYRRYKRLKDEGKTFPDLAVIDGGPGQLKAAKKALEKARVDLEVISLAKEFEIVHKLDGSKISLDKNKEPILTLRRIRDATHDFAIGYNRLLRSKEIKEGFDK